MHYTLAEISALTGAQLTGTGDCLVQEIAYDTRRITQVQGCLFVALPGEWRDGHSYLQAAYALGARAFWVSQPVELPADAQVLYSPDVLAGLQTLARHHREQYRGPVVGITGSNGKTTVKEWAAMLMGDQPVQRSPGSWNSQLGVALSLLRLDIQSDAPALIEAGVSQTGEMVALARMIAPELGLFTHLGDAHDAGFESRRAKLAEKLILFAQSDTVWMPLEWAGEARHLGIRVRTFGLAAQADLFLADCQVTSQGWQAVLHWDGQAWPVQLPVPGEAALYNLLAAAALAISLGVPPARLAERVPRLLPVSMRTELITDNPEITLINDCYTADAESVRNAFSLLRQDASQPRKHLILTDLAEVGPDQLQVQARLLDDALRLFPGAVTLLGPVFGRLVADMSLPPPHYLHAEQLLEALRYEDFLHTTVLLKGARRFALERAIPLLTRRPAQSELRIHLPAIRQNLDRIRGLLPKGTGVIGMVKAAAYGSGSWEVARMLADAGVQWLAVAFPQEGIQLRQRGIETPLMVLNAQGASPRQLLQHRLFPCVGSLSELQRLLRESPRGQVLPIHLEVDTGMGRMGILPQELPQALALLRDAEHLEPVTLFAHLASADDPAQDTLTRAQLSLFHQCLALARERFPLLRGHILNSAGALRFPGQAADYVRLGIALYGIDPCVPHPDTPLQLQEAISLSTRIIRVAEYPAGSGISYGHRYHTARSSRIATLPLGYADGLFRSLSQAHMEVLVHGRRCPVVGTLCMDMCMVDVTDVLDVQEGDEVIVFGRQGDTFLSIQELAQKADTIPYEVLSRISPRVRRVFLQIE
ncbi:MAG: alanine racemase [Bacteroidetes bacterium]|nr:alanine racemase [Bacteroidota bacterium]